MGTIIKSSSVYSDDGGSAIDMAALAGVDCVKKAGIEMRAIGLLINIGVYREENIMEPAIAPLIQKKLIMNNDPMIGIKRKLTLSFDINNGPCGLLSAVSVADAFLKSDTTKYALIVSCDVHPSKKVRPDFPFSSVGAAILLASSKDDKKGFKNFQFSTSGNDRSAFTSMVDFTKNKARDSVEFKFEDDYQNKLQDFAIESVREFISSGNASLDEIKFLVTTQQFKGFGKNIASSMNMNNLSMAVDLHDLHGDPHSSALASGYHHLVTRNLIRNNDRILFTAVGAGLISACSLYVA